MKKWILTLLIISPVFAQDLNQIVASYDGAKITTKALLVVGPSGIIGEYNKNKSIDDKKLQLWSISKTVSALIIGRAIEDGYLKLEEDVIPMITVKNLLQMSSGLDWDESYEEAPFKSNVVRMLYGKEAYDMGSYILKTPRKYKAGTRFKYSSGDSNLLQWYLKKKMGVEYTYYPWKSLFDPLGIKATFETDSLGVFVASSYVYMSVKDLLKIAQLILQKGQWNGQQIVSESFINQMINPSSSSVNKTKMRDDDLNYGFQIWLNAPSANRKTPLKGLDPKSIFLLGHHGQIVGIFPTEGIIIIRSASDRGRIDKNKFFKEILEWAKKPKQL